MHIKNKKSAYKHALRKLTRATQGDNMTEQTDTQLLIHELRDKTELAIITLKECEQKDQPNAALWVIYHLWDSAEFNGLEAIIKAQNTPKVE